MNIGNRNWMVWMLVIAFYLIMPYKSQGADQQVMDESVNLVLRKVGDQLLSIKGDSTTRIPPVEQFDNLFSLKLDTDFNYGDLPKLLEQALTDANINADYHVIIRNCYANSAPILGYASQDLSEGRIPCNGREQISNCNIIELRILDSPEEAIIRDTPIIQSTDSKSWMLIPLLSILALIFSGLYLFKKKQVDIPNEVAEKEPMTGVALGKFIFDVENQTLQLGETKQTLTFREAKILNIFADQPNQIVTRDTLIDEVWGKEGVIVGRSLDVFISRLRKLLKQDEAVSITNIHGVGYKLVLNVLK